MSGLTAYDPYEEPRPLGPFSGFFNWAADLGRVLIESVEVLGGFALFAWQTIGWLLSRGTRRDTLMPNLYQIGVLSLPVIALTGMFIGMVLAVQTYYQFRQLGLHTTLGSVINMSLVRELGPVLAATMLAGRVGCSMAANLGTMRVTEQIDALTSMGTNPIHYLVVPRFLSCLLMIPALTVMGDFMGVVGGYFFSVFVFDIDKYHYWYHSREFVGAWDLFSGIIKSVFFGGAIALVSCHRGFNSGAGAEGVGRAATSSFVYSFVMILFLDLILNLILDGIASAIWPEGAKFI